MKYVFLKIDIDGQEGHTILTPIVTFRDDTKALDKDSQKFAFKVLPLVVGDSPEKVIGQLRLLADSIEDSMVKKELTHR